MKHGMHVLGALGLLTWIGAVSGLWAGEEAPTAETVLRQAAAQYAALPSYQGKVTVTQRIVLGGQERIMPLFSVAFALQRPNRLRAEFELEGRPLLVTCDGRKLWIYAPQADRYLATDAAADFDALLASDILSDLVPRELRPMTLGVFGLDLYGSLMESVQKADLAGTEQTLQGQADHVVLRGQETTLDLWVSKAEQRIVQARLTPWKFVEDMKARQPELESMAVEFAYETAAAGAALPAIAFEPPATAVQAEDPSGLFEVALEGRPFIDFTLEGLQEGTTVHLADYVGNVIALDFWAVFCPPCREELPKLNAMYHELKDKGFVVLAVNVAEGRKEVAEFLTKLGVDVPVALDPEDKAAGSYGVESIPKLVLIGRDGTIEAVYVGYGPGSEARIRAAVQKLLAGESLRAKPAPGER